MRLTEIRHFEQRGPFRPFRICLSDGTTHEIRNPNLLFLARNMVILNVMEDGRELPRNSIYFDPIHITRVETIDPERDAAPAS